MIIKSNEFKYDNPYAEKILNPFLIIAIYLGIFETIILWLEISIELSLIVILVLMPFIIIGLRKLFIAKKNYSKNIVQYIKVDNDEIIFLTFDELVYAAFDMNNIIQLDINIIDRTKIKSSRFKYNVSINNGVKKISFSFSNETLYNDLCKIVKKMHPTTASS